MQRNDGLGGSELVEDWEGLLERHRIDFAANVEVAKEDQFLNHLETFVDESADVRRIVINRRVVRIL